jgi:hypothetical protein
MHNPQVGYCQSMNYVAALLLLSAEQDEERAFWLLMAILEGLLYPGTYANNLEGCHVEMKSLAKLLAKKDPALAGHMETLGCDVNLVATDWFLCLFCTTLPIEVGPPPLLKHIRTRTHVHTHKVTSTPPQSARARTHTHTHTHAHTQKRERKTFLTLAHIHTFTESKSGRDRVCVCVCVCVVAIYLRSLESPGKESGITWRMVQRLIWF